MGLKWELPLRSKHFSYSINKNTTGMVLTLTAMLGRRDKEACLVFSMQHPRSLLASLK